MNAPLRVLVVDDDSATRANLTDILELDGYQVDSAGSVAEALARSDWASYAAIILDRRLPDGTGEQLLPRLRDLAPDAAVMMVTGHADLEGAIAAIRQGAADYITKPINPELIRTRLARIAESKRAAREILRLNQDLKRRVLELQTLLDVIPVGIAISYDPACSVLDANPALRALLGLEGGPTMDAFDRFLRRDQPVPRSQQPIRRAIETGREVRGEELEVLRTDGTRLHVLGYAAPLLDEHGRPRGAIAVFLDITERQRAEERLLQSERLAAIGEMIAGLAHESGNALARSQSSLEMLSWEVEDRPEAISLIGRVQQAQNHLKQLYDEVRAYAAPIKLEREPWDVSHVWRQAWANLALQRQGRATVLQEHMNGVDLSCAIDQFRLEQVFRNIFENSLAACGDPVNIDVRCRTTEERDNPALCVVVHDNGPGLNPEQRRRIFEPFFTTKTKGTGLGMAIAKRIIEAHGGTIAVANSNHGASIEIVLPHGERLP